MRTLIASGLSVLLLAPAATAQDRAAPPAPRVTEVDVLLTAKSVLHAIDMVMSARNLRLSPDAQEGNPLLRPFAGNPVRMAAVSGAVDVLQTYTVSKLQRRHPRVARVWAGALVGLELWATVNNIRTLQTLEQRAR